MSWANIVTKSQMKDTSAVTTIISTPVINQNTISHQYPHYIKPIVYECFISMKEKADNYYYNIFQHIAPNSLHELEYLIVNYMETSGSTITDESIDVITGNNEFSVDDAWYGGVRNRYAYI